MKIFSLETKKHLVGWGCGLGLLLTACGLVVNTREYPNQCYVSSNIPSGCGGGIYSGWPFHYLVGLYGGADFGRIYAMVGLNLIFWVLISFIILFVFRYFKNKKNQIKRI